MSTKIKLQVNHGKHAKQESGQKITINQDKNTQENKPKQQPPKQSPQKIQSNAAKNIKQESKTEQKKKQQPKKDKIKQQDKKNNKKDNQKPSPKKQQKSPKKLEKSSPQKQKKVDKQLETIQRVKKEQQKTKLTIQQLIDHYKNSADDLFTNHGHNEEKERMIGEKLQKLQKEKQQRHRKLSVMAQRSLTSSLQKQITQAQRQQMEEQKEKQKRRKKTERKLEALKALAQERALRQQKYNDYYNNEFKSKVPRFKKYEEQYKEKQKHYEEQLKQKLSKHKLLYSPMNTDQMEAHQQQYQHQRWNLLDESEKKREFNKQLLERQNKQLKAKLWKGQVHKRVREQRMQMLSIQNEARTKLQKTKEYGTIVKDQFKPKISQEKRNRSLSLSMALNGFYDDEDGEMANGKHYRKVARQKYINGVNQGLVVENLRKSSDHHEQVQKGNQYLQYLRSLPKIKKDPHEETKSEAKNQQNPQKQRKKSPQTTFKPKRLKNPYYDSSQTDGITSKSANMDEKKLKDPHLFNYMMADLKARNRQMQLQEKVIRHGKFNGILELQDRHNILNRKIVQGISQKLSILSKM